LIWRISVGAVGLDADDLAEPAAAAPFDLDRRPKLDAPLDAAHEHVTGRHLGNLAAVTHEGQRAGMAGE
jgi:hypothetical protein